MVLGARQATLEAWPASLLCLQVEVQGVRSFYRREDKAAPLFVRIPGRTTGKLDRDLPFTGRDSIHFIVAVFDLAPDKLVIIQMEDDPSRCERFPIYCDLPIDGRAFVHSAAGFQRRKQTKEDDPRQTMSVKHGRFL